MADLIFRHLAGADGEGVYKNGKTGFSVSYFKKKEIDSRYPSGGYTVVGQIGKGKREIGNLQSDDGQTEKVYAATKMPHTAVVGYIETEADKFIAIVKDRLLLWLLFALLIAALIIGLIFLLKAVIPTGGDGGTTTPPAGVIDQNAVLGEGEISIPDKTKTRGRQIKVYGIPELPLAANTKEQSFVFSNPEENPCFFVIEIELSDTGEVIYTSNLLPPGYSISKFTLNRELAAGTYPATIHVKTYSFDIVQRKLNNMDLKTTIVVS